MTLRTVAVVGLGRIGLPFAAFLAARGAIVKGVEQDVGRAQRIRDGRCSSNEPGLRALLEDSRPRFEVVDLHSAIQAASMSFVVVPTPTDADGDLSDQLLVGAVSDIAQAAARSARPHTICVVSTVSPGTFRRSLVPALTHVGDQPVNICYTPVFVALGKILQDLEDPSFILLGADEDNVAHEVSRFYDGIGYRPSLIARTGILNAEIAKLVLNAFLSTKIAFANSIAALCDVIEGGDVDQVLAIVGRDRRVGPQYLRGGAPVSGPCLPRDTQALIRVAERAGIDPILMQAVRDANVNWYEYLRDAVISQALAPGATIAIFGLAYKGATDYTDDGLGLRLAGDLAARGYEVLALDPTVDRAHHDARPGMRFVSSLEPLLEAADVFVLTHPDEALAKRLAGAAPSGPVIDVWRSLRGQYEARSWIGIGRGGSGRRDERSERAGRKKARGG